MHSLPDDLHGAVHECAEAALGDQRRTKRGIALAAALAQHPSAALPEAWGDAAMLTGA